VCNSGAAGSHIGNQVFFSAVCAHSVRWRIDAGCGHLFSGGYLRQSGYPSGLKTVYLLLSQPRFDGECAR
jgi:hypothetical protein